MKRHSNQHHLTARTAHFSTLLLIGPIRHIRPIQLTARTARFSTLFNRGRSGLLRWLAHLAVGIMMCSSLHVRAGGTVVGWGGNEVGQTTPCAQDVVAIAAGYEHSLLLRRNGSVCAAGQYYTPVGEPHAWYAPIVVPPGLSGAVAIASGMSHSLALKADGTVVVWGTNTHGQLDMPADLANVVAISAGTYSSLALKADGRVVAWGATPPAPLDLTQVVAIAAGGSYLQGAYNLALKADGTVVVWGHLPPANRLGRLTNVVAISAGINELLALKADGTVVSSGWYDVPSDVTNVVAISEAQGFDHHINLALRADGRVVGWGYNFYAFKGEPFVPANLTNVVAVASGGGHTLALVGDGAPFLTMPPRSRKVVGTNTNYFYVQATGAWPLSYQWQLNGTNLAGANGPVLAVSNVQSDQAGRYTVIVSNAFGTTKASAELRVSSVDITLQPQGLATFAGGTAVLSVKTLGVDLEYQWRKDGVAILGATNSSLRFENVQLGQSGIYTVVVSNSSATEVSEPAILSVVPVLITAPPTNQVAFRHGSATLAIVARCSAPRQYQWRFNGADLPGATNHSLSLSALERTNSGRYEVLVSSSYGSVLSEAAWLSVTPVAAWGMLDQSKVPASLTDVRAIAAGFGHSLALRTDGAVVAWGLDDHGQTDVPDGLADVIAVAGGCSATRSHALTRGGAVIEWGEYPGFRSMQPPAGLGQIVGMSSGQQHSVTVSSDGNVSVWGYSSYGQNQIPPGLSNVVAVAAGEMHNLALLADGTVMGWGVPTSMVDSGQAKVPAGLADVAAICAGSWHSVVLRADGTVIAWGDNGAGQTNVPPKATNVVAIAAGEFHTLALRGDGTVIAWGSNFNGQSLPPPELSNVVAIAAGGRHSLALIGDGPPIIRVSVEPSWTSDGLAVAVPTRSGRVYALESTESLERVDWKLLPRVAGDGSVRLLKDPSVSGSQRFYRVRAW